MPELPDVEVFKRYLDNTSLNQTIRDVQVYDQTVVKLPESSLKFALVGYQFRKSMRRGKFLFALCNKSSWLVFHFGMTGFLSIHDSLEKPRKHTRIDIHFDNGKTLSYVNMRKLGIIDQTDNLEQYIKDKELGPDAFNCNYKDFKERVGKKKGSIKSALMDQSALSGIGNVYADEVLFQAGIHPKRQVTKLEENELKAIHKQIDPVMKTAVDKEANPDSMPGDFLLPRREEGAECPKCKGKIEKISVSGRSAYVCPKCQE